MKYAILITVAGSLFAASAWAQVYRCGNEYTNAISNPKEAEAKGCKLVEGGNVTVIPAPRSAATTSAVRAPGAGAGSSTGQRVDSGEQRGRDLESRMILEAELRKAETRQAELLKEYNNGEPDKQGIESRNYQRYLDRVADMKASIARNESDIAGLKRELARLPAVR